MRVRNRCRKRPKRHVTSPRLNISRLCAVTVKHFPRLSVAQPFKLRLLLSQIFLGNNPLLKGLVIETELPGGRSTTLARGKSIFPYGSCAIVAFFDERKGGVCLIRARSGSGYQSLLWSRSFDIQGLSQSTAQWTMLKQNQSPP